MASIGSLTAVVKADTRDFTTSLTAAAKVARDSANRMKQAVKSATHEIEAQGRVVKLSGRTAESALNKQNRAYQRAVAAIDPATTSLKRYLTQVTAIRNANRLGQISQDRMNAQILQAKNAYRQATAAANGYAVVAARGAGSSRSMGNAIQQAGFQVGDFAVQVASGQGVLRPFIQQGTQLVSMFGPMGAVIGAAGATLGAVATAFITTSDAAEITTSSYGILADSVSKYNATALEATKTEEGRTQSLLDTARAINIQSRAEITSAKSTLAVQEEKLARLREELKLSQLVEGGSGFLSSGSNIQSKIDALAGSAETIQKLRELLARGIGEDDEAGEKLLEQLLAGAGSIERLRFEIEEAGGALDVISSDIQNFNTATEGTIITTEAAAEAVGKLSEKWRETASVNMKATEALKNYAAVLPDFAAGQAIFDATRTNAEKLAIQQDRLNELLQTGAISQDTFNRAMEDAAEKYKETGTVAAEIGTILSNSTDKWIDGLVDGTFKARDAVKILIAEFAKLAASQAFLALLGSDGSKLGSTGSALGDAIGSSLSGLGSDIGSLLGFQNGGQFQVGGQGGTDSQLVAFRATPNETVSITKPGQSAGSGATISIDARGADIGVEQRIRAMIPEIVRASEANMVDRQSRGKLGRAFA